MIVRQRRRGVASPESAPRADRRLRWGVGGAAWLAAPFASATIFPTQRAWLCALALASLTIGTTGVA